MIEDDLKALTEAIKANTETIKTLGEALKEVLAVKTAPGLDFAQAMAKIRSVVSPIPAPAPATVAEPAAPLTGKNADCLIIDEPAPVPVQAPAIVAKPAVLITPAPAPAPAPAPEPTAPTVTVPAKSTAPTFVTGPAPAPAAPAPAPADPIPTNYKEAKTLGLKMAAEGHSDVLKEFLASCGVKKLIDLPHDRYGDYYKWFKDKGLL